MDWRAQLWSAIDAIPDQDLPAGIGECVRARLELTRRLKSLPTDNGRERILTPKEVAKWLGQSKSWVYEHWSEIGGKEIGGNGRKRGIKLVAESVIRRKLSIE